MSLTTKKNQLDTKKQLGFGCGAVRVFYTHAKNRYFGTRSINECFFSATSAHKNSPRRSVLAEPRTARCGGEKITSFK